MKIELSKQEIDIILEWYQAAKETKEAVLGMPIEFHSDLAKKLLFEQYEDAKKMVEWFDEFSKYKAKELITAGIMG